MPASETKPSGTKSRHPKQSSERVRKRTRRVWTDQEKAQAIAALRANDGNIVLTSKLTGVPKVTLWYWLKDVEGRPIVPRETNAEQIQRIAPLIEEKQRCLADKFEELANKLVDAAFDKIERANLGQTMAAAAIAVEKMRLLRGESTAISETRDLGTFTDRDLADLDTLASRIVAQFQPEKVSKPDESPAGEEPVVVVLEGSARGDPSPAEPGQTSADGLVEPAGDQAGEGEA